MDPQATLALLVRAIDLREYAETVVALNDYYQWRAKGGAQPLNGDAIADRCANQLADLLEGLS